MEWMECSALCAFRDILWRFFPARSGGSYGSRGFAPTKSDSAHGV
jgi:hypothetical protein